MAQNPYRRLRELTLYSQKDFADKFEFSKTTMTQIESGQYADLSDSMIVTLGEACAHRNVDAKQVLRDEFNAETLQDAYHSWQSTERMQIAYMFQKMPSGQSTETLSPFHYFIVDVAGTRQRFCKLLKVPSAAVLRYASGYTRTMPKALAIALREVQFPYLDDLQGLQEEWAAR